MNIFIKSMIITSSVISALGAMDPERTNPSSFKSSEEILTNAKRKIRNNNLPEAALAYLEAERVFNEFESEKQKNNPLIKEMKAFRNLPGYRSDSQSQDMGYFLKAAENGTLVIPAIAIGAQKTATGSGNKVNSTELDSRKYFDLGQKFMSKLNVLNYGTAPEAKLAFDSFKKAADLNHTRAQYMVGVFYKDGEGGIKINKEEAFKYFRKASVNPNELEAYYELGLAYLNGDGTKQNFDLAIKSLEHAVKRKHLLSQIELGILYLGNVAELHKDFKRAESLLKEPARKGDVRAMAALASVYEFGGHGVPQNYKLAFDNYLKAANKGHAPVYMLLSICYSEGKGIAKNPVEAARWLKLSLECDKYTGERVTKMLIDKTEDAHTAALQEQLLQLILSPNKKPDIIEKIDNLLNVKVPDSIKNKTPTDGNKQQPSISIAPVLPLTTTSVSKDKPTQQPMKTKPRRGNQKPIKAEVVAAIKETAPLQPMENPAPVITQETLVYTRMGLKKINVEGVKAIYEKTLVRGEIYEANPNKEKMITHILKHQNEAKPEAKSEIPQIVLSDAERFANDNTSLTLFDTPKEKPKRKIRIENPLKKLSKRAEDWKARQIETPEEKAARKTLRNQRKVKDSHPEGFAFETSSFSQSIGDFKSHFSMTDSESQSTKSLVSQNEGEIGDATSEMRNSYPQLFHLLKKMGAQNISEVKFKSSNIIRATLTIMQKLGFIDGTIGTANIHVTRKNSTDAFVSHTTHGSGKHAKWYHNPAIVGDFFDFITKCDPVIAEYLNTVFEEKYISKDIPRINDAKKLTDNAPNEAGED